MAAPISRERVYTKIEKMIDGVTVLQSGNTSSLSWLNCDGFVNMGVNLQNDANTQTSLTIIWSMDGATIHGAESVWSNGGGMWSNSRSANVDVKAPYCKFIVVNNDATASHVMNAWAYLKA